MELETEIDPAIETGKSVGKFLHQLDRVLGMPDKPGFIEPGPDLWRQTCREAVATFRSLIDEDPKDVSTWLEASNDCRMAYRGTKMAAEEDGNESATLASWIVAWLGQIADYCVMRSGRFPERDYLEAKANEIRVVLPVRQMAKKE